VDPVLGTVVGSAIATAGAIAAAVITGRNNAERVVREDLVRRLKRYIRDHCGLTEDEVDDL
jgi:hypothetical protein